MCVHEFFFCYFCQSYCCMLAFRFSLQSSRFFAFGSFTFLFHHFHVVCCHHTILSSSLPFFHSLPHSFHSTHIYSSIHPSIYPFSCWIFFPLAERFFSSHFFCIYLALALNAPAARGCEDSVVWCKHNLSHYPKTVSVFSLSSVRFQ